MSLNTVYNSEKPSNDLVYVNRLYNISNRMENSKYRLNMLNLQRPRLNITDQLQQYPI